MTEFTPAASLIGGILIGLAAVLLMVGNGRVAGVSGLVSSVLPPLRSFDEMPKLAFVLGLVGAPLLYQMVTGIDIEQTVSSNYVLMAVAGLLVGFGSVFGSGCTSGHGICGLARLSLRSIVSVVTFMAVAAITVFVARHVVAG